MPEAKTVQIIGGGLAGLTLGIALRREKVPVTIHEAGHYPRHRVCGEFISGRGQQTLARLGLREQIETAGAVSAATAAFFTTNKTSAPRPLPAEAVCLSRFKLDALLVDEFQKLGGELICGQRRHDEMFSEGFVRASGRRLKAEVNGERWFGLKIHARNVSLAADLEMHLSPRGYVGLCKLSGGEVNVCGLFRRRPDDVAATPNAREWLRGVPGSPLRRRLDAAVFDESSFCAVAGISLQPQSAAARPDICVGDAISMIPPVTGNGMSMAFESAELAVEPLAKWSRGIISWPDTRRQIAHRCDTAFSQRLAWANWLQRLMLTPSLQNPLLILAARSEWFWRMTFERTR